MQWRKAGEGPRRRAGDRQRPGGLLARARAVCEAGGDAAVQGVQSSTVVVPGPQRRRLGGARSSQRQPGGAGLQQRQPGEDACSGGGREGQACRCCCRKGLACSSGGREEVACSGGVREGLARPRGSRDGQACRNGSREGRRRRAGDRHRRGGLLARARACRCCCTSERGDRPQPVTDTNIGRGGLAAAVAGRGGLGGFEPLARRRRRPGRWRGSLAAAGCEDHCRRVCYCAGTVSKRGVVGVTEPARR